MPATQNEPSKSDFQEKAFQWGLGLIILGLIGLILPTFGLQLWRLRRLGEMQWVVLVAAVVVGCGAVLWSRRGQIILGISITSAALCAMFAFAYLSFWRHTLSGPLAQETPPSAQSNNPTSQLPPQPNPISSPPQQGENQAASPQTTAPQTTPQAALPEAAEPIASGTAPGNPVPSPASPSAAENPESTSAASNSRLVAGHPGGEPFGDESPPGGVLVGLRCAKGKNWGGALHALQPIYQVGTDYVLGKRHGSPGGEEEQLLAKPGYAIGAIHARAGLVLNALQVVYYRIQDDRLDAGDHYETDWVGCDGGGTYSLDAKGAPLTGLFGTWHEDIVSFGLKPAEKLSSPIPLASGKPPDLSREPRTGTIAGSPTGPPLMDTAPDGGVLVGIRGYCDQMPRATLRSIQPIYLQGDRYVEGKRIGEGGTSEVLAIARPGFSVSGIGLTVGGDVCGIRLTFRKLSTDDASRDQEYESPCLGYQFQRPDHQATAGDRVPIGLICHWNNVPQGMGFMLIGSQSVKLAAAPELPTQYRAAAYARPPMRAGSESGNPYEDVAPEGGLLVGLRCAQGSNWGGALQAIQPIYQVGSRQVQGKRHGKSGGRETRLLAKPGYAVGAIHARAGLVLNAIQISFYRIDGPRLDPSDHYETQWVGSDGGGSFDLDGQGDPITGIFGTWHEDIVSIGCSRTAEMQSPVPLAKTSSGIGDQNPQAGEFRKWTSADGKSTVEAKMVGMEADNVRLERRDGKVITVPLIKLSPADVNFARSESSR